MFYAHVRRYAGLVLAAAALLAVTGCANGLEVLASGQNGRILNPDGVQGPRPNGYGRSKGDPNDIAANRLRNGSDPTSKPCPVSSDGATFSFFCKQSVSESDVNAPAAAREYLAAGLTLSNEVCDSWFNRLQVTQITLRQTADSISSAGAVTSAILGFTHTNPETIGLAASLFGAGKQNVDNIAANYIVAVDLTSVAAAVREYRALYAREIEQSSATWNYYTARRVIMAYDNTCSALSVKRFVNVRVEGGSSGDGVTQLYDTAIAGFVGAWSTYFTKAVTVSQLTDIYAYEFLPDTPDTVRQKLLDELTTAGLATSAGVTYTGAKTQRDLKNGLIFANIDGILKDRALVRVSEVRQALNADAAAKTADARTAGQATADAAANAATAESLAASADQKATDLATKADAAQQQVAALNLDPAATTESLAAPSRALIQTARDARSAADNARAQANQLLAQAAGLRSLANSAGANQQSAQQAANAATTAAPGAGIAHDASHEPVPLAADGRPLDTPPKP